MFNPNQTNSVDTLDQVRQYLLNPDNDPNAISILNNLLAILEPDTTSSCGFVYEYECPICHCRKKHCTKRFCPPAFRRVYCSKEHQRQGRTNRYPQDNIRRRRRRLQTATTFEQQPIKSL